MLDTGKQGGVLLGICIALSACPGPPKQADTVADEKAKQEQEDKDLPKGWSGATTPSPKPAAAPNATSTPDYAAKGTFDEEQVTVIMARAAKNAHTCVEVAGKNQPHGEASVTVTFSGKGKSTASTINAPFEGTQIGECAKRAFINQIISPFEGMDVTRSYKVDLTPDKGGKK
jgi:hypothetical protein